MELTSTQESSTQRAKKFLDKKAEKKRLATVDIINVLRKHEIPINQINELFEHVYNDIVKNTIPYEPK